MRFVPIKTEEQLDVQAMHRVRDRLVQRRTALINEIRGFLLERGISFAVRPIHLRKNPPAVIDARSESTVLVLSGMAISRRCFVVILIRGRARIEANGNTANT
jgi:hypothetical protein